MINLFSDQLFEKLWWGKKVENFMFNQCFYWLSDEDCSGPEALEQPFDTQAAEQKKRQRQIMNSFCSLWPGGRSSTSRGYPLTWWLLSESGECLMISRSQITGTLISSSVWIYVQPRHFGIRSRQPYTTTSKGTELWHAKECQLSEYNGYLTPSIQTNLHAQMASFLFFQQRESMPYVRVLFLFRL